MVGVVIELLNNALLCHYPYLDFLSGNRLDRDKITLSEFSVKVVFPPITLVGKTLSALAVGRVLSCASATSWDFS